MLVAHRSVEPQNLSLSTEQWASVIKLHVIKLRVVQLRVAKLYLGGSCCIASECCRLLVSQFPKIFENAGRGLSEGFARECI